MNYRKMKWLLIPLTVMFVVWWIASVVMIHLDKMLKDFQQKQFSIQTKQMSGEEITDDMMKQFQDLYAIIVRDPKAAEYIQCELRFSVMMNDVYKILGEAVLTEKERQEAKAREENAAAEVQKASETDDKGKAD